MFEEVNESMEFGCATGACGVSPQFNASMVITELLAKTLENCGKDLASRCIKECASRHGFDAIEEMRVLGLENVSLIRKQMSKKSGHKAEKKAKSEKKPKEKSSSFPLPFNPNTVNFSKCNALTYNRGLFTQCPKEQMANSCFCKGCQAECDASATGIPTCGTVQQRLACGLYEFKDPKGRSPIRYTKVLEKAKMTETQAQDEAGKLSIVINPEHFVSHREEKKSKGRPKKAVGVVEAADVSDLFAKLTAADELEEIVEEVEPVAKKPKLSEEEKEAKRAALQLERDVKKKERENKLAAEKAEREAKRKAEADQKKAAKEQEQKEKEAKKAAKEAEKEAKEAEKEAKKAAKAAKEAEKEAKKAAAATAAAATATAAAAAPAPAPAPAPAAVPAAAAVPAKITVKRIKIDGKEYLKSSANILYNPETKEEIGIYDEQTNSIKPLPEEESDEEEEEEEEELYEDYDSNA